MFKFFGLICNLYGSERLVSGMINKNIVMLNLLH